MHCYFSLCFISFVAFMREVNRSFSSVITFFQYSLSDVDIRRDKFILALFIVR